MRFRRAVSVLVLAAFLPLAVGCSSQRTVRMDSDPGDTSPAAASNQPTKISGYTTTDSEFHEWDGQMSVVGTDSLEFARSLAVQVGNRPPDRTADKGDETIRLAKAQVVSVDVVDSHPGRSVALGFGLFVVFFAGIAAISIAMNGLYN
jgi:hypothetical protein